MRRRHAAVAVVLAVLTGSVVACGSDDPVNHPWRPGNATPATTSDNPPVSDLRGTLAGAGASSQESAMQAWVAGFGSAHPDVTVSYDPVGSGGGRTQFLDGGIAFGGTDAPLDGDELARAAERCGPGDIIEIPLYVSPIAVIFNLDGIETLNMSPATLAAVFAGGIERWDDPRIAEENPGVELPGGRITPVHRSDESGTTENFTEYLHEAAGEDWPHDPSGNWPVRGGQSAQGTSGVVQTVIDGVGTIGYADASKAGSLGTVALGVAGEFVPYSPEGAAALVDVSPEVDGRPGTSIVVELDRTPEDASVYPLVLISYTLACTAYPDATTAGLVREFLGYMASEAGQATAAETAGVAPVSPALRERVLTIVEGITS